MSSTKIEQMSVYIPRLDAFSTPEYITHVFENVYEIGKVHRIEMVPRINNKNGQVYYACFIYFAKWFNGYNAQYLYQRLAFGQETLLYHKLDRYWILFSNTSEVRFLPLPTHINLYISYYHPATTIQDVADIFESLEFGKVNLEKSMRRSNPHFNIMDERSWAGHINLVFDYWNHSVNAHRLQEMLKEYGYVRFSKNRDSNEFVCDCDDLLDESEFRQGYQHHMLNDMLLLIRVVGIDMFKKSAGEPEYERNPYIWHADMVHRNNHVRFEDNEHLTVRPLATF